MNKFFATKTVLALSLISSLSLGAMDKPTPSTSTVKEKISEAVDSAKKVGQGLKEDAKELANKAAVQAKEALANAKLKLAEIKANSAKADVKDAKQSMFARAKDWMKAEIALVKANAAVCAASLQEMKARGWTGWTTKEKTTVVLTTAAVAALVTYVAVKIYKKVTAKKEEPKRKVVVRKTA